MEGEEKKRKEEKKGGEEKGTEEKRTEGEELRIEFLRMVKVGYEIKNQVCTFNLDISVGQSTELGYIYMWINKEKKCWVKTHKAFRLQNVESR